MFDSERWDRLKGISWGELLVGLLLSALLSPVLAQFITPGWIAVGLLSTPEIKGEVQQVDSIYTEGTQVEKFDNITWEEGYEVYRVRFRSQDGPTLDRATFEVRFPGCVKETAGLPASQGHGAITVNLPLQPEIQAPEYPDSEVLGCTIQVVTEDIHTNEGYTLEFVVDHEFSKCDLLSAYNPRKTFFIDYEWNENGQKIERRMTGEIQGADDEFQSTSLPANSTKLTQQEDYSAFLYAAGDNNSQQAIDTCFA